MDTGYQGRQVPGPLLLRRGVFLGEVPSSQNKKAVGTTGATLVRSAGCRASGAAMVLGFRNSYKIKAVPYHK